MPQSKRFSKLTPFTVSIPEALWLSINTYKDNSGKDLTAVYEEALDLYFQANPSPSVVEIRSTGRGGVRKTIWLPQTLGEVVRSTGHRISVTYAAIIVTALYGRFRP